MCTRSISTNNSIQSLIKSSLDRRTKNLKNIVNFRLFIALIDCSLNERFYVRQMLNECVDDNRKYKSAGSNRKRTLI